MLSRRARISTALFFLLGLLFTAIATFNQYQQNAARIKAELGKVASRNADDIVQRIFRLQYGLRDLHGIVIGASFAGAPDQTGDSIGQVFEPSLELNGATGYGFSYQHTAKATSTNTIHIQALEHTSQATLKAMWGSPEGQSAMQAAASRQAPTLSPVLASPGPSSALLLVHTSPLQTSGSATAFVFFDLSEVIVDLRPAAQNYRLDIDDVTHIGRARNLYQSDVTSPSTPVAANWISTREIFGRRWRFHANIGPEFAESLRLTLPQTVAAGGGALSALLTACLAALFAYRSHSQAVRLRDKQLASIVQDSSDAFVMHDADGRIVNCNEAASALLKTPLDTLIGMSWFSLQTNATEPSSSDSHAPIETSLQRGDGSTIDVWINTFNLSNLSANEPLICRTIRDNRAKIAADNALLDHAQNLQRMVDARTEESEAATRHLQTVLETIRCHAIYSVADKSGTIVDVNDEFCRISGYSRDELIGKNHRIINSGAHPPAFWKAMWSTITQGETWHGEVCNRSKTGDLYWVDSIIAPFRSGDGRIDKYISLRTDITARKRAEVRLLTSSEGFLERAGQIAGVGGWELDLATGEMSLTRQSRTIFGIPDQENLSLDGSLSFFLPPYRDQLRRAIFDAIQHRQNWDLELPFVNRQGVQRWVRTLAEVECVPDQNTPIRLVGAMQDVTDKHETEEALTNAKRIAEAANSAKTEFLANMSHEIRTPLNAVIGMTHVLGEALKQDDQREWVAKIQSASKSLLAILNDVLDLSKIEAGELRIDHTELSIRGLVAEMKALFSTQARSKGLDFSTSVAKDVPDRVVGDPLRIRQVLTNLLGNALKFTTEGSVSLIVGCITRTPDYVQLQFAVMDTGIGMSPESAQTIFDPFTQADASTTRQFGGTGLGLSIVKRLVTLMDGSLGVHSRLHAGSEFWFRLPLAIGSAPLASADDLSKLQVRMVGVDERTHKSLRTLIEQLGWHLTSKDGDAALTDIALCAEPLVDQPDDNEPVGTHLHISIPAQRDPPWTALTLFNAALDQAWSRGEDARRLYLYSHVDNIGAQSLHQVRILVVDDSDINREVASRLLRAEGATVDQAENGHDALALLKQGPEVYDAVLMDIQMPFMDGMQATQKIRHDLGLSNLPIVALTAGVLASERERAIAAGMTDFVSKPLDPLLLLSSLRHHIQQYRRRPLRLVPGTKQAKLVAPNWPTLPCIDMAHVTAEFKFDQPGYQRLLSQMVAEFGTQAVDWLVPASPLASPDLMLARLHKLAGTAAVLGASDIAKLAKATEHALRADPTVDVSIELAAIYESMAELQEGLNNWVKEGSATVTARQNREPQQLNAHAVEELSQALQHHRLDALALFEALASTLQTTMPPDTFNQLEQAIQSLDFGQAWGLIQSVDLKPVTVG